jgi:hypothetical protein
MAGFGNKYVTIEFVLKIFLYYDRSFHGGTSTRENTPLTFSF